MPPRDPNLPEGTDSIIDGEADLGGSSSGMTGGSSLGGSGGMSSSGMGGSDLGSSGVGSSGMGSSGGLSGDAMGGGTSDFGGSSGSALGGGMVGGGSSGGSAVDVQSLKSQASDKVRDVASQGKDRATEALDSVSRLVSETADTVDDRLGPQYGNYVRKAAGAIEGLNDSLRGKQVDELFDDARNMVRKSPAVAIGAAAAIGFLLVRLVKSGMPQTIDQDDDYDDYYAGGTGGSYRGTSGGSYGGSAGGQSGAFGTGGIDGSAGTPPRVDNSYDPIA